MHKVSIVIYSLSIGGAQKQAVSDANLLKEQGYSVTVICGKHGELEDALHKSIRVVCLHAKSQLDAIWKMIIHLMKHRYDVLHAHMFWAQKITAIPAFLTSHKLIFNEHGLGNWRKWYHRILMRFISIFADKVICSCELNCKLRHEKEHISWAKLQTVYNGFSLHDNAMDSFEIKERGKDFIIGFTGRFHEVKRIHTFTSLVHLLSNKIPSLKCLLVGEGPELEKLSSAIQGQNMGDYFMLPGFQGDMTSYYRQFDVFVLPSRIEGFSLSLLEAGIYGVPALAYDVGGNREIIDDGKTGFILPDNDVSALADAIYDLYRNPEKCKQLGLEAREKVLQNFSPERRVRELKSLYQLF